MITIAEIRAERADDLGTPLYPQAVARRRARLLTGNAASNPFRLRYGSSIGDLGPPPGLAEPAWYKPWTWGEEEEVVPVQDEQSKPIFAEVRQLGRVKTTCLIRKLQGYALDYLKIRERAAQQGKTDIVAHCDSQRRLIDGIVDYLYGVIDFWFAGEGGREAPIPPGSCVDGCPEGLGVAPAAVAIVVGGLVTLGVAGTALYIGRDIVQQAIAVGYCALTDNDARCKEALAAAKPPADSGEPWYSGYVKKAAIGAGVVLGGYIVWRIVEGRMLARSIAAGVRAGSTGELAGHATYTAASRTAKRLLKQAQRAMQRGEQGKARQIYQSAEKHLRAAQRLWQQERGARATSSGLGVVLRQDRPVGAYLAIDRGHGFCGHRHHSKIAAMRCAERTQGGNLVAVAEDGQEYLLGILNEDEDGRLVWSWV